VLASEVVIDVRNDVKNDVMRCLDMPRADILIRLRVGSMRNQNTS
jgi:hypothetical protein